MIPTLNPWRASSFAKRTLIELLPTPPFPLITPTTCLILFLGLFLIPQESSFLPHFPLLGQVLQLLINTSTSLYFHISKILSPIVFSGIETSKLSAMLAPKSANVFLNGIKPCPFIEGLYAIKGTISFV